MNSRKISKSAFTLAEVLITLGIIGVVAAMTMPTLLNSTQGAQYRTAYKKALSVLSQAIVLNVALDDYDTSQATYTTDTAADEPSLYNLFKNRMNVVAENGQGWTVGELGDGVEAGSAGDTRIKFGDDAASNYTFFFNDGIVLSFPKTNGTCDGTADHKCTGVIDVNGNKNPNKLVSCDGDTTGTSCKVDSPTDIYPIRFEGQSIFPNSHAARAVMYSGK